jgi:hypothetical protein
MSDPPALMLDFPSVTLTESPAADEEELLEDDEAHTGGALVNMKVAINADIMVE